MCLQAATQRLHFTQQRTSPRGFKVVCCIHITFLWLPTGTETAEELLERASSNGNGAAAKKPFDGRAFRRALGRTGRYQRNPVNDPASLALMEEHGVGYSSTGLIAQMRLNGNLWQQGVRARPAVQALQRHPLALHRLPAPSLCAYAAELVKQDSTSAAGLQGAVALLADAWQCQLPHCNAWAVLLGAGIADSSSLLHRLWVSGSRRAPIHC